jgi:hypothetical protein
MNKANADATETGKVVDKVKADTQGDKPMTNDDLNKVDTSTPDVQK